MSETDSNHLRRTAEEILEFCHSNPDEVPPITAYHSLPDEDWIAMLVEVGSVSAVADRLSLPGHMICRGDLMKAYRQRGIESIKSGDQTPPLPQNITPSRVSVGEKYWQKRAELLEDHNNQLGDYYTNITNIISSIVPKLDPVVPEYPHNWDPDVDEELVFLFLSDTHIGENVKLSDTSGLSVYNMDIFKQRCETYKAAVDNLVNGHLRKAYPLRHCYMGILGDMTTGEDIFKKQMSRIDRSLMEQIFIGAYHIADIIRYVCSIFDSVTVYAVSGNHGETQTTTLNSDYMLYAYMAAVLSQQENLRMLVSDSEYCGIYIDAELDLIPFLGSDQRWNFLFTHAHQARGWSGIPYYGMDKLVGRIDQSTGIVWDKIWGGHHHRTAETEQWELVGSWVGGTEYSMHIMQAASRPTQRIRGFHPKKGLTWSYDIYLGDVPRFEIPQDQSGIYTPHNELIDTLFSAK